MSTLIRCLSRSSLLSHLPARVRPPVVLFAIVALVVAMMIGGCAKGGKIEWESPAERAHPLVGRIWDVKAGAFIGEDVLVARLVASRFVLLGERHDNADHHALQAKLVRAMVEAVRRLAPGSV